MKKNIYGLTGSVLVLVLLLGSIFGILNSSKSAFAQADGSVADQTTDEVNMNREALAEYEAIKSFSAIMKVNVDNSLEVAEVIKYSSGSMPKHGIYRDINMYSSEKRKMNLTDISVTDEQGTPHQYETSNQGKNIRLKIGDPDSTFTGDKTYVIRYKASHAVAQLEEVDEIYWNVTGNEWNMSIESAEAYVMLPAGAELLQNACYYGPAGSTEKCQLSIQQSETGETTYIFKAPDILYNEEGLTVALGFQKGIVTPYPPADNFWHFVGKYVALALAILLPVLTFIFTFRHWLKYGRDPKGTDVIVPQYEVIDNLTPMEVDGIAHEKVDGNNISAEIIHLAVQGYLKINQIEEKVLLVLKNTDYELVKLKDFSDLANESERKLMSSIFEGDATSVKLSDLKYKFYPHISEIQKLVLNALLSKGYYRNLGVMKTFGGTARTVVTVIVALWAGIFFGGMISVLILRANPVPLVLGIFVSVLIYGLISKYSPSKTEKGVAAKEHLLGLREYLQIAEKDRLHFHNAPEKKPEVFEKLLPYAMVLGVANIWAKEFEGIYLTQPSWYSSSNNGAFNAVILTNALSDFGSQANSTMSAIESSGGSGGGGFSGGGGGGGGGGSW